jgi:hypothetical protein
MTLRVHAKKRITRTGKNSSKIAGKNENFGIICLKHVKFKNCFDNDLVLEIINQGCI